MESFHRPPSLEGGRVSIHPAVSLRLAGWSLRRLIITLVSMTTTTALPSVTITSDGGCLPNPGNGGWACVLRYGSASREISGAEPDTTNNRMEWLAIIRGLEALTRRCKVVIRTDSMVCFYGLRSDGKKLHKRANLDLVKRARELFQQHEAEVIWIKGHNGDADNERCDELAAAAILKAQPF